MEGKLKKRKRESPLPPSLITGVATADVIVVGGGPAKDLESNSDSDIGNPGPDSAVRTSTLKL